MEKINILNHYTACNQNVVVESGRKIILKGVFCVKVYIASNQAEEVNNRG